MWTGPLGLPVLDVDKAPGVIKALTFGVLDEDAAFEVTGDWRDQHGWENQVATVARAYDSLPPDERAQCTILARNYGQASAVHFFGRKYGLPQAICTSMTYYLWGPGE